MSKKIFSIVLSVILIATMMPLNVFAGTARTTKSSIVVSDKRYEIAPDISEREYILNNENLTAQQMGHVLEVKLGKNAQIIAGYNDYNIDSIKSGSNWKMRKTTEQAFAAEKRRKVNVVGAVNGDFFDMSNGRPRGVLVMNSTVIQKSSFPCFYIDKDNVPHIEESSANLPDDVKEAIGGAYILVRNGQVVDTGDTTTNPRTAVGIKADGTVILYMVDGRQAPLSVGMTGQELAQTMYDLGCVSALNLDGGGSSTFATQRAGDQVENESAGLTIRCKPSDGYERTVSSSLLVVSNAEANGEFNSAVLSPNDEVYTPGSTIEFIATGADKSGAFTELPESGLSWSVTKGNALGTINLDGVFTAKPDETGEVTVALLYNGKKVGETSVQLQWPDKLGFTNSSVSLDFGETSDLSFAPTWQGREVHYKDGDFEWSVDEDGLSFTKNVPIETYYKTGWGAYQKPLLLSLKGENGKQQTISAYHGEYLVYETTYKEGNRAINVLEDGSIQVEESISHIGSNFYNPGGGKLLIKNVTGDSDGNIEKTVDGYICKVTGLVQNETVGFSIGKFSDNCFTADEEITSLKCKVSVSLKNSSDKTSTIDVVVGLPPYILMDFEDGHTDPITGQKDMSAEEYWTMKLGNSDEKPGSNILSLNERKKYRLSFRQGNGKNDALWHTDFDGRKVNGLISAANNNPNTKDRNVRFGDYAMNLAWDFTQIDPTTVAAADFGFSSAIYADVIQPTKIGFWINVPAELKDNPNFIKMIFLGGIDSESSVKEGNAYFDMDADGNLTWNENKTRNGTTQYLQYYSYDSDGNIDGQQLKDWAGKGWKWIEADLSSAKFPIGIQLGYTIRIVSPQNYAKTKGDILVDNLQLIYGTNTNDINNPVIESVIEKGSNTDLKNSSTPKFETTQPLFDISISDSKAVDKYASGIDTSSVKLYIDGYECTSGVEIAQTPNGECSVLMKTSQLLNGEHALSVRVKDNYGNETEEEYRFTIESKEAVNAAVGVMHQENMAAIGHEYSLEVVNQSEFQAEYVDAADVTIEVGSSYGAAIKNNLTEHIAYGAGYEEAGRPEYVNGKVILHIKKKVQDAQNSVVYGKTIAILSVNIPTDARKGDTFNYAVPSGYYVQNAQGMTFSQAEQKIPLSAEYEISAGEAIVGYSIAFNVIDKEGNAVDTADIKIYNSENVEIGNPHTFTAAGRYTVYAKDEYGNRSWNYNLVVNALGTDENGKPFGIQNNISKDGSSQKTVTWLAAIDGSRDAAYIKLAESEAALNSAESKAGTSRLFTFTETNSGNAYRLNEVKLNGLESGKTYYYKVGDGETWSEVLNFTTAASDKNADTNFFIFADIQTSDTANLSIAAERVKAGINGKTYDFGIQTGDAVDDVTIFNNWRGYLTTLNAEKLGSIDVMHTLGNHEYYGDADGKTAGSIFSMPTHAAGSYYSAEYGSVYTGVINDGGDILAALEEAKQDAAKSECAWKVLVFHQPVYGTESVMSEAKRIQVVQAIEDAGFDAVFSGDDHAYARTFPMKGDKALKEGDREGIVYFVCGDLSGKDNEYHNQEFFAAMIPHSEYSGMYLSVEASKEKMVLNAYRYNGEILDSYTIEKSDCELGKHTFNDKCVYNMEDKTIEECSICHTSIPAEESGYTGMLSTKDGGGQVMLASGKVRTGWFVLGEDIYHAGENGLIHATKTYNTATCLENGNIEADCECGEHYKGAFTYRKGHTWDEEYKCIVCGTQGKNIANVILSLVGKYWEYTGEKIYPKVIAKDGDYELIAKSSLYGTDAYKSYKDNIEVGMGTVIFDGRGNYYGTNSIQFPIVPRSVETLNAEATLAGAVTLKWDAAAGAQYYRVYQKAEGSDWVKIGETEECGMVVTGLKPQTKYSFRIGTGAKVNGLTIRGLSWSGNAEVTTPEGSGVKTSGLITGISADVQAASETVYSIKTVEKDGKLYLMMPSFSDLEQLHLRFAAESELQNVTVFGMNGSVQTSENEIDVNLSEISSGTGMGKHMIYVSANEGDPIEICVMKSEKIPALYLNSADAENQGRDFVDASKQNITRGSMTMLDENGNSIYENSLKQIKARGNSTFKYYPKKSYQIKLSEASDLLGTGETVKTWVLLAGYGDATQMHDKLFKDLAKELEMPYVADCSWVDLYYDNEYRGTYLLSEKNAVGETGVNITDMEDAYAEINTEYGKDSAAEEGTNRYEQKIVYTAGLTEPENITGGYLIERNLEQIDEINGFYTRTGSAFNVKSPEFIGQEAMNYISEYYQEFEDAVYAKDEDGNYTGLNPDTGKYYYEYCDKESLAKVVLLQQLALNPDGFRSSFYFYKDKDGLMYAGPIWDQEMTLGTGFTKKIDPGVTSYHYLEEALMQIPEFRSYLTEYYNESFKDEMKALIGENGKTAEYYEILKASVQMNYELWPYVEIGSPNVNGHFWKDGTKYDDVIADMNSWLEKRISKIDYIYGDKSQHTSHDYAKTVTKAATYTEEGIMTYKCRICGDSYTVPIEKLTKPSGGGGGGGAVAAPDGNKGTVVNIELGEKKITSVAAPTVSVTEKDGETITRLEISQSTANDILLKAKENASTDLLIQPDDSYKEKKSDVTEIILPKSLIEDFISGTGKSLTVSVNGKRTELSDAALTAAAAATSGTTVVLRIETDEDDADIELKDGSNVLYLVGIDEDGFYHRITEKNQGDFKKIVALEKTEAEKIFASQKEKIEKIKCGVKETKLKLKSLTAKKGIKLIWSKDKGYAVDGYQVYRSVKKNRAYGVKPFYTVKDGKKHFYINTKQLKKGCRYYYKVRGFRNIDGEMVYTLWSNKAYRKVR